MATRSYSHREREVFGPPSDAPWVFLPCELLFSPAWRAMSINARRLLDFLQVEHRNHGGMENGNLKAPYDQLVLFGIARSEIKSAISELDFLGLVRCEPGGRWAGTNKPSIYRITFYHTPPMSPPTNDWKRLTPEKIDEWKKNRTAKKKAKQGAKK